MDMLVKKEFKQNCSRAAQHLKYRVVEWAYIYLVTLQNKCAVRWKMQHNANAKRVPFWAYV
jgi:hypothetical protein